MHWVVANKLQIKRCRYAANWPCIQWLIRCRALLVKKWMLVKSVFLNTQINVLTYLYRHSPGAGWADITNRVDHVSNGGTPGSTILCERTRDFHPALSPASKRVLTKFGRVVWWKNNDFKAMQIHKTAMWYLNFGHRHGFTLTNLHACKTDD